jgi:hypothetical protein
MPNPEHLADVSSLKIWQAYGMDRSQVVSLLFIRFCVGARYNAQNKLVKIEADLLLKSS